MILQFKQINSREFCAKSNNFTYVVKEQINGNYKYELFVMWGDEDMLFDECNDLEILKLAAESHAKMIEKIILKSMI